MKPLFVYIAGPLSLGDTCINVRNAVHAADALLALGHLPFVPHLSHLWHTISPHDYEEWLALDFAWLSKCDCIIRLPGESAGANREVLEANRLGLPVFDGVGAFTLWLETAHRLLGDGKRGE